MRSRKRVEDRLDNNNVREFSERETEEYTRANPASLECLGILGLKLDEGKYGGLSGSVAL